MTVADGQLHDARRALAGTTVELARGRQAVANLQGLPPSPHAHLRSISGGTKRSPRSGQLQSRMPTNSEPRKRADGRCDLLSASTRKPGTTAITSRHHGGSACRSAQPPRLPVITRAEIASEWEPMVGLEPTACCLRNSCSTTELHRRFADDTERTEKVPEAGQTGETRRIWEERNDVQRATQRKPDW